MSTLCFMQRCVEMYHMQCLPVSVLSHVSGDSTQMHYAKLTIEESATGNITDLLTSFDINYLNHTVQVNDITWTTSKHIF